MRPAALQVAGCEAGPRVPARRCSSLRIANGHMNARPVGRKRGAATSTWRGGACAPMPADHAESLPVHSCQLAAAPGSGFIHRPYRPARAQQASTVRATRQPASGPKCPASAPGPGRASAHWHWFFYQWDPITGVMCRARLQAGDHTHSVADATPAYYWGGGWSTDSTSRARDGQ